MKNCPIARCRDKIPDRMFCCSRHWNSLPAALREELVDGFNDYHEERISLAEFADIQRMCLASIGERVALKLEEEAARAQVGTVCTHCGAHVVRCFMGGRTVHGDQVRNAARRHTLQTDGVSYCVVGGDGVLDLVEHKLPQAYARFKPHVCNRVAAAATLQTPKAVV